MLISEEYRHLNAELHERNERYGVGGRHFAGYVNVIAKELGAPSYPVTVLDYGCGKGTLAPELTGLTVAEYDPAIPGKEQPPPPADIVVCSDVLEHIEPACLVEVLLDLERLTRRVIIASVSTRSAHKTLADGRNAHLIVKPLLWWLPQLLDHWDLRLIENQRDGFFMIGAAK